MRRLCLVILTLALLGPLRLPADPAGGPNAQVLLAVGKVEFQLPDQTTWHKLRTGMSLDEGTRVRTREGGRLSLQSLTGAKMALAPNTEILISALGGNAAHRTAFQLFQGLVRAVFKAKEGDAKLDVYTSDAVAAVKGTDLQIERHEQGPMTLKVFSSEHEGVLLSSWKDFHERLIRPGEEGEYSQAGLNFRALGDQDLKDANDFQGLPHIDAIPTPPAAPPAIQTAKQRLTAAVAALVPDKKAAALIVAKALSTGMSGAMLERLIEEKHGASEGDFTKLAKDQGMGAALDELNTLIPGDHPNPGPNPSPVAASPSPGATPAATPAAPPAVTPAATPAPPSTEHLLQDAVQALNDLRQDVARDARQDQLLKHNDLLQGSTFIDQQGYRVVLSHVVNLPNAKELQIFDFSQRQDGPNTGESVFSHDITYNKALPEDWTVVYKRALNDPDNLANGSPDYFKTQEFVSAAAPNNDCSLCISHVYSDPVLNGAAYAQAHQDFYSVLGLPKGQQSFDATGALQLGSDTINITAQQLSGQAWQVVYFNQTSNEEIFTAKVWLLDSNGVLQPSGSFGSGINHLGGFGPADSDLAYDLQLSAPGFNGKGVDVLVPAGSFEEALP